MPREAKGEVRQTRDGLAARITLRGKLRETYPLSTCRGEVEAQARADILAKMAQRFRKAGVLDTPDAPKLLEMAAAASAAMLPGVLSVADSLVGGTLPPLADDKSAPTFRDVGRQWTSGELHKRFPDRVELPKSESNAIAEQRLDKAIYPLLGDKWISRVTRLDCDRAMQLLPVPKGKAKLARETRRQYAGLINRVLNLAELAGYIERNPLPRGWVPKGTPKSQRKRFPILYPREDRALLGCPDVPLALRLLYGFLHREGPRRSEAAALQFADLDLLNGTIALDENKTNHPRWWKLGPGVAAAFEAWRAQRDAKPEDFVFIDDNGGPLNLGGLARRVRDHLHAAKLERADLFSQGTHKGHFGTHSFRRSYVTRELANGKSDDHVRQRTGHTSDELYRYRVQAHELGALDLGDVDPLLLCVPELSPLEGMAKGLGKLSARPPRRGNENPRIAPRIVGAAGFEPATPRPPACEDEADPPKEQADREPQPSSSDQKNSAGGNRRGENDPVEQALADAITRAAAAEQWTTVETLSRELTARRKARAGVASLEEARRTLRR